MCLTFIIKVLISKHQSKLVNLDLKTAVHYCCRPKIFGYRRIPSAFGPILIFCVRFRDIIILLAPYPLPSDRVGQLTAGKTCSAVFVCGKSVKQLFWLIYLLFVISIGDNLAKWLPQRQTDLKNMSRAFWNALFAWNLSNRLQYINVSMAMYFARIVLLNWRVVQFAEMIQKPPET